jgi:hypothetical protein
MLETDTNQLLPIPAFCMVVIEQVFCGEQTVSVVKGSGGVKSK